MRKICADILLEYVSDVEIDIQCAIEYGGVKPTAAAPRPFNLEFKSLIDNLEKAALSLSPPFLCDFLYIVTCTKSSVMS